MNGHDAVLADLSLEISATDLPLVPTIAAHVQPGTRIHVTALGTESPDSRRATASELVAHGLTPVPHLAARRFTSPTELEDAVSGLAHASAQRSVFVIGGDPRRPAGPYSSARDLIESGVLARHHVADAGVGGYPEGHPDIPDEVLWAELAAKVSALEVQGISPSISTQVCFDADVLLAWVAELRQRHIWAPVRVGAPGPMGVARLLGFAKRVGIGSSAGLARKYGTSIGSMLGTAGPDEFLSAVQDGLDPRVHGDVSMHLFTFGGVRATLDWLAARP
ncbi:methylenetetrahydrofolate reductase [Demequina sp. B12]|uniref:methylenetetrahydrofolate reductase n=1 Tax=Demequina sp. B12 TaxID=2992757 RepID=UPI00237AF058|nr:methylenetetrahydrofolate reductase [Demequina sp. B12]MDE0573633.1 methylenetetrahydrofolate reductase [Demequina sp. B12]